jgi:hypothetical protein
MVMNGIGRSLSFLIVLPTRHPRRDFALVAAKALARMLNLGATGGRALRHDQGWRLRNFALSTRGHVRTPRACDTHPLGAPPQFNCGRAEDLRRQANAIQRLRVPAGVPAGQPRYLPLL